MKNEIVVGDVVRLKAGGPTMTVGYIEGENARCVWFEKFGSDYGLQSAQLGYSGQKWTGPFRDSFALASLEKCGA